MKYYVLASGIRTTHSNKSVEKNGKPMKRSIHDSTWTTLEQEDALNDKK